MVLTDVGVTSIFRAIRTWGSCPVLIALRKLLTQRGPTGHQSADASSSVSSSSGPHSVGSGRNWIRGGIVLEVTLSHLSILCITFNCERRRGFFDEGAPGVKRPIWALGSAREKIQCYRKLGGRCAPPWSVAAKTPLAWRSPTSAFNKLIQTAGTPCSPTQAVRSLWPPNRVY
jgi:hypothetical protein